MRFLNGQTKPKVRIFVLVTFLLYSFSRRSMENKEKVDFVSHESGMGTPPTHLPVPPPYNEMLSANSYVPISNILTQTRDILYPQTMQQPQNTQQIMLNNENNRSMTTKTQHTSGDMMRSQPSAQIINNNNKNRLYRPRLHIVTLQHQQKRMVYMANNPLFTKFYRC